MAAKHIAIATWLEALELPEYLPLFSMFSGVEDLLYIRERDIRELGVKSPPHRAKIVSSLQILKAKYEKGKGVSGFTGSLQKSFSSPTSFGAPLSHHDSQNISISSDRLKADLERELQADPSELKSRAWYHGSTSRQHAESLVINDGDFLVRDCISRPGDFVLTCHWKGVPLHFMINALVGQCCAGELPQVSYQFEEQAFSSIQELIDFYQSHKKPVTSASNATLKVPIARSMPLSYYDAKYGALSNHSGVGHYGPMHSPVTKSTSNLPESPRMYSKNKKNTGSQPLLSLDDGIETVNRTCSPSLDRCDSLPIISMPQSHGHSIVVAEEGGSRKHYHQRSGSEPVLMPTVYSPGAVSISMPASRLKSGGSDSNLTKPPPPKPSRIPSVKYTGKNRPHIAIRNIELYEEDDRDYSDYMQVKEDPSWLDSDSKKDNWQNTQVISSPHSDIYDNNFNNLNKNSNTHFATDSYFPNVPQIHLTPPASENPVQHLGRLPRRRLASDTRFSILDRSIIGNASPNEESVAPGDEVKVFYDHVAHKGNRSITIPKIHSCMSFNLTKFSFNLLPQENKPLESSVMISVKSLLLNTSAKRLAEHCTRVDLEVLQVMNHCDLGVGIESGLELITLPQGKQLRQDIIERCHCLKVMVMVTILTCSTVPERARMLSHWLQVAMEMKLTMGNLFGFINIMEGIVAPQIRRLRDTWMILRQNHTNSAYLFDTKLKTAFRLLGDGTSSLPLQGITIPNVVPVAYLLERDLDDVMDMLTWEQTDANLGLETFLAHLDVARIVASQYDLYRTAGNHLVAELQEDSQILDIFRTELHLLLLWGTKGAGANRFDRHRKFDQLLTILSDRAEPPGYDGTAV